MINYPNLKLSRTQRLFIVLIFSLYSFFVFKTLTKYPFVFYDETVYNNTAYCLSNSQECSSGVPFNSHLAAPEKQCLTSYTPVYFWLMAVVTKTFGFDIYTVRITSYCIGIITLCLFFFLLRNIIKDNNKAILCLFLLAVDYAFINSSKFGRPDILTICFLTGAILFYLKTFTEQESRNDFLLSGIFYGCAFMTHMMLTIFPLGLTMAHFLFTRRYRKFGFKTFLLLLGPTIMFFSLWFIFYLVPLFIKEPDAFSNVVRFYTYRKSMNFSSLWYVFKWFSGHVGYELVAFYIYAFLGFAALICFKKVYSAKWFFALINIPIYPYLVLEGNYFHASLATIIACITFGFLASKSSRYKKIVIGFIIVAICCNIARQGRIIAKRSHYSYEKFSQEISSNIRHGAKVLIYSADPDPYFYLAANRKDLRLEYDLFSEVYDHMNISPYFRESVAKTDYVVTSLLHGSLKTIVDVNKTPLSRDAFIEKRYAPQEKPKVDELIIIDELIKRGESYIFLDKIEWVVIKLTPS